MNAVYAGYAALHGLTFVSFLVATWVAFVPWWKGQSPLALKFLQLNLGFTTLNAVLFVQFFALVLWPQNVFRNELWVDAFCLLAYSALASLVPRFLFELLQWPWQGWRTMVTQVVAWSGPAALVLLDAVVFDGDDRVLALRFFTNSLYLPVFLAWMAVNFALAFRARGQVTDRWKQVTLRGAGLVFVCGLPFFVFDSLWPVVQLQWKLLPQGMGVNIVVFLAWNVFFVARFARFPHAASPPAAPKPQPVPAPATAPTATLDPHHPRLVPLTTRERQVVDLVVAGLSNPQIAQALGLQMGTTKNHIYNVYNKTGASNRRELVAMLVEG